MAPWLWLILLLTVLVVVVALTVLGRRAGPAALEGELAAFRDATGPARCERAVGLLRLLARVSPPERLHELWDRIEDPLIEALPDCPPPLKDILINRLDQCHGNTSHRDYQRRIMTVRNSLVGDDPRL